MENGVHQTLFGTSINDPRGIGNCTQAAVASMLGLGLDDVPHFVGLTAGDPRVLAWFHVLTSWSLDRFGFTWLYVAPEDLLAIDWPDEEKEHVFYVGGGLTPRGSMHSVVVDADLNLVWDPHPSGVGIDSVVACEVPVTPDQDEDGNHQIVFPRRWISNYP